jgi:hypothetical protein
MSKRYNIQYIKEQFEKEGYVLLSTKYTNSNAKLKYRCPKGHEYYIRWRSWLQGGRCLRCAAENRKIPFDEVKHAFEKEGYVLLSEKYENIFAKLKYVCPEKHESSISYHGWKKGQRCKICAYRELSIKNKGEYGSGWKGGVVKDNLPLYNTYAKKLNYAEEVRPYRDKLGRKLLEVKCSKCGNWCVPNRTNVASRIASLNGTAPGENRFYCSQTCKDSCEIFNKAAVHYIEPNKQEDLHYSVKELKVWSNEVLSRAKYICEICGAKAEHAHHIQPKKLEPALALDPENGLAVCRDCHYKYGHQDDCSTIKIATKICV